MLNFRNVNKLLPYEHQRRAHETPDIAMLCIDTLINVYDYPYIMFN